MSLPRMSPLPWFLGPPGRVLWSAMFMFLAWPAFALREQKDVLDVESTVLQWYFKVTRMHPHAPRVWLCRGLSNDECLAMSGMQLGNLSTGYSITHSDVELFTRLSTVFSPRRIFIVGNAWGYSSLVLSYIFDEASVDVIDAGAEGGDNLAGIRLTRTVARLAKRDVAVFWGYSPKSTRHALRSKDDPYELAFIDGDHTNTQMFQDFVGIYPHLAERSVVVLHDVMFARMQQGMYTILCTYPEMRFVYYTSLAYPRADEIVGTGFMYRGFPDSAFAGFHSLEIPYRCERMQAHKQPLVYMVPKLLAEPPSRCLAGILKGELCCAPECLKCGGLFCDEWPGSGPQCCGGSIKDDCTSDEGPPPCKYPTSIEVNPPVWM